MCSGHMSEDDFPEPKARPTDMQMTVQSSAVASAVVALQDPRELPLEERLQHVCLIDNSCDTGNNANLFSCTSCASAA